MDVPKLLEMQTFLLEDEISMVDPYEANLKVELHIHLVLVYDIILLCINKLLKHLQESA